ncbi:hypothetical protein [Cellulomonas sp. GbtcB1]|uniref:hypothetical protein n=1 Tax=Cellulomonas sp. GbtcB1 TaxID=2824746 RepID=UPI001C3103B1|nr:hypothetical protein [Cellulomonas sp. GbtcB1]
MFGYRATTYTTVRKDVPAFIEAVEVRPANEHGAEASVRLARWLHSRLTDLGRAFGQVFADREYSYSNPDNWHHPMRALGAELVFDLNANARTIVYYRGIMFVDGTAYCPGMPEELRYVARPRRIVLGDRPPEDEPEQVAAWEAARREFDLAREIMQAREPYELVRNAGNGAGKERYICQALRGHAICPLRAFTLQSPNAEFLTLVTPPPDLVVANGICVQKSIVVPAGVDAKNRQRHPYLSQRWFNEYRKRSTVERSYASIKHPANEDVGRGWVELFGLLKVSFMFAIGAMSQNLRLVIRYLADHPEALDESDLIMRGPAASFGHEELNEAGEIELYDELVNPDPDPDTGTND